MKKIWGLLVLVMVLWGQQAGAGIYNNSGTTGEDSISFRFSLLDSLGNPVQVDTAADWGYVIIFYPGGDSCYSDSFIIAQSDAHIELYTSAVYTDRWITYKEAISALDAAGINGTYTWYATLRDSSLKLSTPSWGEFQLVTQNDLSALAMRIDSLRIAATNILADIRAVGADAVQDNGDGRLEVNVEEWRDAAPLALTADGGVVADLDSITTSGGAGSVNATELSNMVDAVAGSPWDATTMDSVLQALDYTNNNAHVLRRGIDSVLYASGGNVTAIHGDTSAASGVEGAFDNVMDSSVRLDLKQLRLAGSQNDAVVEAPLIVYNHGAQDAARFYADSGDGFDVKGGVSGRGMVITGGGTSGQSDALSILSTADGTDGIKIALTGARSSPSKGIDIVTPTGATAGIFFTAGDATQPGIDFTSGGSTVGIQSNITGDLIGDVTNKVLGGGSGTLGANPGVVATLDADSLAAILRRLNFDSLGGTIGDAQMDEITVNIKAEDTVTVVNNVLNIASTDTLTLVLNVANINSADTLARVNSTDAGDSIRAHAPHGNNWASTGVGGGGTCDCGTGAQTVSIKVADTSLPYAVVPGAKVSVISGGTSLWGISNGSGIATLYLDVSTTYTLYAYANGYNFTAKSMTTSGAATYSDSILGYDVATNGSPVPSTQQVTLYDWAITPANDTLYGAKVTITLVGSSNFYTSTHLVPAASVVVYAGANDGSANGGKWQETIFGTDSLSAPGGQSATYEVLIEHDLLEKSGQVIRYTALSIPASATATRLRSIVAGQ